MYKTKRSVAITSLFLLSTQKNVHCKYVGGLFCRFFHVPTPSNTFTKNLYNCYSSGYSFLLNLSLFQIGIWDLEGIYQIHMYIIKIFTVLSCTL